MLAMDENSTAKARWARGKAASLYQQARELEQDRGGDWRARARRKAGAARLRSEATRYDRIASRFEPFDDDQAA